MAGGVDEGEGVVGAIGINGGGAGIGVPWWTLPQAPGL